MEKKERCIIVGCVKNCGRFINNVFSNIEFIQKQFAHSKVIVAYDTSNDNTLYALNQLQNKFDLTILINKGGRSPTRTVNIERARNVLLKLIYEKYRDFDYFIMMDLDNVCSKPININVLTDGLKDKESWDALFFNNERYYDLWALSFDNFQYSCFHNTNSKQLMKIMLTELLQKFNTKDKYISCNSAFGGFGIYKISKFINCQYKATFDIADQHLFDLNSIRNVKTLYNINYHNEKSINDCEHRYFHLIAKHRNNARLKISRRHLFPKIHSH